MKLKRQAQKSHLQRIAWCLCLDSDVEASHETSSLQSWHSQNRRPEHASDAENDEAITLPQPGIAHLKIRPDSHAETPRRNWCVLATSWTGSSNASFYPSDHLFNRRSIVAQEASSAGWCDFSNISCHFHAVCKADLRHNWQATLAPRQLNCKPVLLLDKLHRRSCLGRSPYRGKTRPIRTCNSTCWWNLTCSFSWLQLSDGWLINSWSWKLSLLMSHYFLTKRLSCVDFQAEETLGFF